MSKRAIRQGAGPIREEKAGKTDFGSKGKFWLINDLLAGDYNNQLTHYQIDFLE